MAPEKSKENLVYQVETDVIHHSHLTKLSLRRDITYFSKRAGLIRILNLLISVMSTCLLIPGYKPEKIGPFDDIRHRLRNPDEFTGYEQSKLVLASFVMGCCTTLISLGFILLLYYFMEVRCELLWETVNQKFHVLACILSVIAAFLDVVSIQHITDLNCKDCSHMSGHHASKYSSGTFYPPHFIMHYAAFVGFLTNAMLYSIASRIWIRNTDY